jgi:hypothetical protein
MKDNRQRSSLASAERDNAGASLAAPLARTRPETAYPAAAILSWPIFF